jgi:hypothetical protein
VVEGTGLENRHTGNGIESSNLSLSAPVLREACPFVEFNRFELNENDVRTGGRVV